MKNIRYWLVVVDCCMIMMAMSLGTTCLGFFVEPVTKEFGYERGAFTLYFSFLTSVGVLTMPILGRSAGEIGVRRLILIGGTWSSIAFVGLSFSSSLISFYVSGILLGVFFMASSGFGGAVISIILPDYINSFGWRTGYLLLAFSMFILTVPVALFLLRNRPEDAGLKH